MRRRRVIVLAAALVAASLCGCVSLFVPAEVRTTSTPTGERVAADVASFYSQVLRWSPCEQQFQCATATAPMDWSDPGRESIELALIRSTATSTPAGSLLVNPGGPGGSGYDFIRDSLDYAVSADVRASYDIVGFDPRGVNRSSAVSCYSDADELDDYLFGIPEAEPGSVAFISELEQSSTAFGAACLENTGELLGFVDTASAARDVDLLRSILGDEELNYLGYSYGTLLGATYAELFPNKTGRLVLDGAVDPASPEFDVTALQAQGFEKALRAYLADCRTSSACPFDGSVDQAVSEVGDLLDSLDASPLRAPDGRELGRSTMFYAIILPLYSVDSWPYLDELFASVAAGDAEYAFTLADSYFSRDERGAYADNSTEALIAVNCLDYGSTVDVNTIEVEAAELERLAPVFGPSVSFGGTQCAGWPFPPRLSRGPIDAAGSAPILVVGTTGDPATPYAWAQSLAAQLEDGHLVTYDGEGHTAYNKSNGCVNGAVDAYLLEGRVPATDPMC